MVLTRIEIQQLTKFSIHTSVEHFGIYTPPLAIRRIVEWNAHDTATTSRKVLIFSNLFFLEIERISINKRKNMWGWDGSRRRGGWMEYGIRR